MARARSWYPGMSGARSTVVITLASSPLLSVGAPCCPMAVPIPIPVSNVSNHVTSFSGRSVLMIVLLSGVAIVLLSPVAEMNGGGEAGLGAHHPGGVALAREILGQCHVAGSEAVHAAVPEADLHLALEGDDVLA